MPTLIAMTNSAAVTSTPPSSNVTSRRCASVGRVMPKPWMNISTRYSRMRIVRSRTFQHLLAQDAPESLHPRRTQASIFALTLDEFWAQRKLLRPLQVEAIVCAHVGGAAHAANRGKLLGIDAEILDQILAHVEAQHLAQHDAASGRPVADLDDLT
jgi:hypothetical protein